MRKSGAHKPPRVNAKDMLSLLHACPLCKTAYSIEDVSIVERDGSALTAHAACHSCGQALLALVSESAIGISSIAARTDCTLADAKRFARRSPVSEEDLLVMHRIIQRI